MKIARSAPVDFKAFSTRCTQTGNNASNSSLATSDEIDDMIPSRIFSLSAANPNKPMRFQKIFSLLCENQDRSKLKACATSGACCSSGFDQ
jgi:hypothetical protein